MTMRLEALLFAACERFSDSIALEDTQGSLTYRQLAETARGVGASLRTQGIAANDPVLVPVANTPRDIANFLGVWAAGGVVVPVARSAPAAAIEATRAATGARLSINVNGAALRIADATPPVREMLKDACLIIFTSGSTGAPKGVVLSHKAFSGKLAEIDSMLGCTPQTQSLLVLQVTFIFGIWFTLVTLMKGGRVFMALRFDADLFVKNLRERGITDVAVVPTMLRKLLAAQSALPDLKGIGLKRIHTGGEPFSPTLGERLREVLPGVTIVDIFGLTETASSDFFSFVQPGEPFPGGIGHCVKQDRVRIADAEGRAVPQGDAGELQIRTPFVMNGYLDRPDLTQAAFAGDYFRTGDLARERADGSVELIGRGKDLIVRGGAKISPLELDHVIARHPKVAAAMTVGVADDMTGERIHVLVVPRGTLDERELRAWAASQLERFKLPDAYHFGSELPTGRTGKVDRGELRRRIAEAKK